MDGVKKLKELSKKQQKQTNKQTSWTENTMAITRGKGGKKGTSSEGRRLDCGW